MKSKTKKFGWISFILWVLTFIAGYLIGQHVADYIVDQLGADPAWMITFPIAGMVWGFVMGSLQWLLLFRYGIPFWWVIVSTIGGILMFFLQGHGFVISAILQSLILYQHFYLSGLWVLVNVPIGFIRSSLFTYMYRNYAYSVIQDIDNVVFASDVAAGVCGGIITGFALFIILRNPKIEDK